MKKRILTTLFWAIVLLSLSASIAAPAGSLAAKAPQPAPFGVAALLPATAPWFTQYVQHQVDPTSLEVGEHNSIAFSPVTHQPHIAYYDATNQDLILASPVAPGEGNCGENEDWWCRVVDGDGLEGRSSDDVGKYSSIAFWKSGNVIGHWKLGISYHNATDYSLRYAVYSCALLTCEWSFTDIDTGIAFINIGLYTSLQYDFAGNPHIAYYSANSIAPDADVVKYATFVDNGSGDCGPDNDWACDVVDSGDGVGKYASLDLNYEGQVYIAYYDQSAGDLKYAYYAGIGNCGSGNVWYCTTIDGDGIDAGVSASLVAPQAADDPIRVAYQDLTNHKLRFAFSGLASGEGNCGPSDSWYCNMLDDMSSVTPGGISMQLDPDGNPFIAYQSLEDHPEARAGLSIARPYTVYQDAGFGNCGEVPPGYLFLYWRCTIIDGAGSETEEAQHVSLAVDPGGLAAISYSEMDSYYLATSLKVAYQKYLLFMPLTIRQ